MANVYNVYLNPLVVGELCSTDVAAEDEFLLGEAGEVVLGEALVAPGAVGGQQGGRQELPGGVPD